MTRLLAVLAVALAATVALLPGTDAQAQQPACYTYRGPYVPQAAPVVVGNQNPYVAPTTDYQ